MSASMQELIVNCLCVGAGSCVGAIARYLMGLAIPAHQSGFPLGTFAVNVIGAFAIAFIATWFLRHVGLDARLLLFLMTGVCGGFTTFSSFTWESLQLIQRGDVLVAAPTSSAAARCALSPRLSDSSWRCGSERSALMEARAGYGAPALRERHLRK